MSDENNTPEINIVDFDEDGVCGRSIDWEATLSESETIKALIRRIGALEYHLNLPTPQQPKETGDE